jgi:Tol biopolymer transport system component
MEDKAANDVSSDDRFLLYNTPANTKTGSDIWVLPLRGDRKPSLFVQTNFEERLSQFSPDVGWVSYQSNESGRYEIYIKPFPGPGGQSQVSADGGIQARWRPDGKELYYLAPDGKLMAVPIDIKGTTLNIGSPVALFQTRVWGSGTNTNNGFQYDVAPDGHFLINVTTEDAVTSPISLLLNWKPAVN